MARDLLDLHGFKTDEIADAVDRFLTRANDQSLSQVRIMTGKGTGAVKKQVMLILKKAHYPWSYEKLSNGKDNEGVLVIQL
jgi:DNA-nicking Smr family endonuclease